MIFPNKVIEFQNSALSKTIYILDELSNESLGVLELYNKVKRNFEDLNQFILTLEVLNVLKKIKFDPEWEVLVYVKKNQM